MREVEREIVYDHVVGFINSFEAESLKEMRKFADENYVPILERETESFIKFLIAEKKPKKVLELGTAIAYSAIAFSLNSSIKKYTTIEIREDMTKIARENIKKYNLSDVIEVINDDAYEAVKNLDEEYDLIFIDAAKGQYKKYFEVCEKRLAEGGIIICDNILFRGMVSKDELLIKRMKTMVNRLREFIKSVKEDEKLISSIVPIGDGLLLVRRKNE